ncbi:PD-(D/E)XK nuclease family protein [Nonomuraea longicatena]|uniref:PD-(D/E)XK endonuclease-like domain-containing protein n=1 Tax=Nonomuraea longicatena TaxID=83682 RepID=A0ABP4BIF3_9ACTN
MDFARFEGNPDVVRLSASLLDQRESNCRDFAALKARPKVRSTVRERRRYNSLENFPLGPVTEVLNAVEFDGDEIEEAVEKVLAGGRSVIHPGVETWVRHACSTYLEVAESLAAQLMHEQVVIAPARHPRIVQVGPAEKFRALTAWGRWYESPDGSYVEFRRLRMGKPLAEQASTLAMAFVAAAGRPVVNPRELYTEIPVNVQMGHRTPQRIRVLDVGLTTGTDRVLIDMGPEEIRRAYQSSAQPIATSLLRGGSRTPGGNCVDCKARNGCDAVPVVPGLLGLAERGTHRRTWSITTSRYYEFCPAQAHLKSVHLPSEWTPGEAEMRGRDVHRWLEVAHERGVPCSSDDLPEAGAEDFGLARQLMERADYARARPYLVQHLTVCPLRGPGAVTDVRAEPRIAAYDSASDVLVLANPDLLRRVDGRLVYREQKTSAALRGITAENALDAVPQLALAVCLIAAGTFGDTDGLVELEQLHPDAVVPVLEFDTSKPEIVAAARAIIHRRVRAWHVDTEFRAKPGWWCGSCPVSRWCPDAPAGTFPGPGIRADLLADDDEPPF